MGTHGVQGGHCRDNPWGAWRPLQSHLSHPMLFLTLATVLCPYNYCYYYFLLLCSDADKVDFIWASPLFSALRKVDIRSEVDPQACGRGIVTINGSTLCLSISIFQKVERIFLPLRINQVKRNRRTVVYYCKLEEMKISHKTKMFPCGITAERISTELSRGNQEPMKH